MTTDSVSSIDPEFDYLLKNETWIVFLMDNECRKTRITLSQNLSDTFDNFCDDCNRERNLKNYNYMYFLVSEILDCVFNKITICKSKYDNDFRYNINSELHVNIKDKISKKFNMSGSGTISKNNIIDKWDFSIDKKFIERYINSLEDDTLFEFEDTI